MPCLSSLIASFTIGKICFLYQSAVQLPLAKAEASFISGLIGNAQIYLKQLPTFFLNVGFGKFILLQVGCCCKLLCSVHFAATLLKTLDFRAFHFRPLPRLKDTWVIYKNGGSQVITTNSSTFGFTCILLSLSLVISHCNCFDFSCNELTKYALNN